MRMKTGVALAAGLGVGYVLGTRAGRAGYERIRMGWHEFTEIPPLQNGVDPIGEMVEPIVEALRTGTDDLPEPQGMAALAADQLKERLHRTGSVADTHHAHLPEELIKERM